MLQRPPRATRTYTLFPYTTRFRSDGGGRREASIPRGSPAVRALGLSKRVGLRARRGDRRQPPGARDAGRAPAGRSADRCNGGGGPSAIDARRSEEHTSELQSLMRISYAVFCLKKKNREPTNIIKTK